MVFFVSRSQISFASEETRCMNSTQQSISRSRDSLANVKSEGRSSDMSFWTVATVKKGLATIIFKRSDWTTGGMLPLGSERSSSASAPPCIVTIGKFWVVKLVGQTEILIIDFDYNSQPIIVITCQNLVMI